LKFPAVYSLGINKIRLDRKYGGTFYWQGKNISGKGKEFLDPTPRTTYVLYPMDKNAESNCIFCTL